VEASTAYRLERFGRERTGIINRFLPRASRGQPRLLDVGCATGFFLEAARQDGWDVHGLEANPYQADFARGQGLDVHSEAIEDTTFPENHFDAVTMFEVIEHVHAPLDVLRKVRALLRDDGMIFLYTPNYDCAERLIMGTEAHFLWGSNHLTYFNAATLADALTRAGFRVEHVETQGLDLEDMIWYFENSGQFDMAFARAFRHHLQFLFNASAWGKNLRMYARKA
jgi:2-polyprenyl-3-methyl-5-hydroxy-6-metoxy-1,4-benzoquinol methylase